MGRGASLGSGGLARWEPLARRPGQPRALYLPRCPISLDRTDLRPSWKIATPYRIADGRFQCTVKEASDQTADLNSSSCMAVIISSHRTTAAMMNSIHSLLSENHPCTLFMASLHPGYHALPNPTHYHIYGR